MPRGSRQESRARVNVWILIFSTIAFYVSTGIYIAAVIWNQSQVHHLVSGAMGGLFSQSYDGRREISMFGDLVRKQSWMAVIALEASVSPRRIFANNVVLIRSRLTHADHHWRRDCMVARVRRLEQQNCLLHRTSAHYPHSRFVPVVYCTCTLRLISPMFLDSLDPMSHELFRRQGFPSWRYTTHISTPLGVYPSLQIFSRFPSSPIKHGTCW